MISLNAEKERKLNSEEKTEEKITLKDLNYHGSMMRGPTTQIVNRNLSFEDRLKALSESIFEVLAEKPDDLSSNDDIKMPKGLKVDLLSHQKYSMKWLKWVFSFKLSIFYQLKYYLSLLNQ